MCYLLAKEFAGHGCLAYPIEHGKNLVYLSDYLTSRTFGKGIEIITVSRPEGYPEYGPYEIVESEKDFVYKVLSLVM